MYEQNNKNILFVRFFLFVQYNGSVVVTFQYAKTQEASRGFHASDCENKPERLGGFQNQSGIDGTQPIGSDSENCPREGELRSDPRGRKTNSGKIFERLNLIEDAFLSYVHSHQEDLKSKFEQSLKQEQNFLDIIGHLKEEVYDLVSEDEAKELDK